MSGRGIERGIADAFIDRVKLIKIPENFKSWKSQPDVQADLIPKFNKRDIDLPIKYNKKGEHILDFQNFPLARLGTQDKNAAQWNLSDNATPMKVYIAVSGSGKTHEVFRNGSIGYVLYSTAGVDSEYDSYMQKLYNELTTVQNEQDRSIRHAKGEKKILTWICAKLASLYHLIDTHGITPKEFMYSQTNGRSHYYAKCYEKCLEYFEEECKRREVPEVEYDEAIVHNFLVRKINHLLENRGRNRGQSEVPKLGIAFDEANYIHLRFPKGLRQEDRSMLVGIKSALSRVIEDYKYITFAGTSLSLKHGDVLMSPVAKETSTLVKSDFKYHTVKSAKRFLEENFDVQGCSDVLNDTETMSLLIGRPRLVVKVIFLIGQVTKEGIHKNKNDILRQAIKRSFDIHTTTAVDAIKESYRGKTHDRILLLRAIESLAIHIGLKENAVFTVCTESSGKYRYNIPDLVASGICHLKSSQDNNKKITYYECVEEPLSRAIVSSILKDYADELPSVSVRIAAKRLVDTNNKGLPFEELIMSALCVHGTMARLCENIEVFNNKNEVIKDFDWIKRINITGSVNKISTNKDEDDHVSTEDEFLDLLTSYHNNKKEQIGAYLTSAFGFDISGVGPAGDKSGFMLCSKFEVSDTHYKRITLKNDLQLNPRIACYYGREAKSRETAKKKAPELYLSKERMGLREKFDKLYNKLDKVLLISIVMPKRSRDVQFDKTVLTDKEFYMEITQQKLHYLFKDPVVVSTLEQVLGKKDNDLYQYSSVPK
ncbi:PLR1 [Acrasis kona]|uniref:PLR1 n=1 Tax=Acrasis kona TaxID=1008807 RepID=A0AAW2Z4T7_9EUKA